MGYEIKIETPLDWMGATDLSEYAGVVQMANDPTSALSKTPLGRQLIVHGAQDIQRIYLLLGNSRIDGKPFQDLMKPEVAGTVWAKSSAIADAANEPGKFSVRRDATRASRTRHSWPRFVRDVDLMWIRRRKATSGT